MEEPTNENKENISLKENKVTKKISTNEFENFINPFFHDISDELLDFLEFPSPEVKETKNYYCEYNFLVSSLRLKKNKSLEFINLLEQQPITKIKLRRKKFKFKNTIKNPKINLSLPEKNDEIEVLKGQINNQYMINSENKREILKILENKIPIICHRKIQLVYDYQIVNNFKYPGAYVHSESAGISRPLVLKSLLIEKLEYMNLFDNEECAINRLNENEKLNLIVSDLSVDFNELLP